MGSGDGLGISIWHRFATNRGKAICYDQEILLRLCH